MWREMRNKSDGRSSSEDPDSTEEDELRQPSEEFDNPFSDLSDLDYV